MNNQVKLSAVTLPLLQISAVNVGSESDATSQYTSQQDPKSNGFLSKGSALSTASGAKTSKVLSERARKARLTRICIRTRTQVRAMVERAIAPLFCYYAGTVAFSFPSDATSNESIGAWLTEGDIVLCEAQTEVQTSPGSGVERPVPLLLAKMRIAAGRQIQNLIPIENVEVARALRTVEKLLTFLMQRIDRKAHPVATFENSPLKGEDAYVAFKAAAEELSTPFIHQIVSNIVRDAVAEEALTNS